MHVTNILWGLTRRCLTLRIGGKVTQKPVGHQLVIRQLWLKLTKVQFVKKKTPKPWCTWRWSCITLRKVTSHWTWKSWTWCWSVIGQCIFGQGPVLGMRRGLRTVDGRERVAQERLSAEVTLCTRDILFWGATSTLPRPSLYLSPFPLNLNLPPHPHPHQAFFSSPCPSPCSTSEHCLASIAPPVVCLFGRHAGVFSGWPFITS